MNILERIAPNWVLKRRLALLKLEQTRAYYEAASTKGRAQRWRAANPGPRGETEGDLSKLRERARDLVRNDAVAKRGVRIIAAYTVGTGIQPSIRNRNGEKDPELQRVFNAWANSSLCDARGRQNFGGLQRMIMRSIVTSGEALILRRLQPALADTGIVPLQLLAIEGDYLDSTKNDKKTDWQGVRIQDHVPVGYWLYEGNPTDTGSTSSKIQPASEVIHVFEEERPGQIRGVSWLAPVLLRLRDLDQYADAELTRRKVAACFAAFVESTPDLDITDDTLETFSNIEPGAVSFLAPGQKMTFSNPPSQVDYEPFVRATLQRIATGLNVPYEHLSGNLKDVNFSSARIGQIPFRTMLEEWQYLLLIPQALDRIWQWFTEAALLSNQRGFEGATCEWIAPRVPMLDVEKETEAAKTEMRAGLKSISEAIRETGRDPDVVLAEIAADGAKMDGLGITLDSDPRKTSTNGRLHSDSQFGGGS